MKNKIKQLLIVIMTFFLIFSFSLNAYAAGGNGEGDDTNFGGNGYISGGADHSKSAYLIYIVDKNGNLLTPVVEAAIDGYKTPPVNGNYDYELSKFGNQAPSRFVTISGVPTPFTSSGDGNGTVLKNKLLSKSGDSYLATAIIKTYFGNLTKENFLNSNEDQYLIFEGVYWITIHDGALANKTIVATSTGWAKALKANGYSEYGPPRFGLYTNKVFPNCMKFEYAQLGYAPCPSGKQTNSTIISSASGIISVWNNEVSGGMQTTYDESKGDTPAPPADESDGTYTIVKNYRYSNDNGNTFINAGCYNIKNIASNIQIEDEQSYKVVGYKISTTESTNINSLTWESSVPGTITQSGTRAKTVTLSVE